MRAKEGLVTDVTNLPVFPASNLVQESRLRRGTRRDTLYAMIEEYHASVSKRDVAAAWLAARLVGLSLLGLSGPP